MFNALHVIHAIVFPPRGTQWTVVRDHGCKKMVPPGDAEPAATPPRLGRDRFHELVESPFAAWVLKTDWIGRKLVDLHRLIGYN